MERISEAFRQRRQATAMLIEFYKEYFQYRFKEVDVRCCNRRFIFDYQKDVIVDTLRPVFEILDNPNQHTQRELENANGELERRKVIVENTMHFHFRTTYIDFQEIGVEDIEVHINGRLLTAFKIDRDKIPFKRTDIRREPKKGLQ